MWSLALRWKNIWGIDTEVNIFLDLKVAFFRDELSSISIQWATAASGQFRKWRNDIGVLGAIEEVVDIERWLKFIVLCGILNHSYFVSDQLKIFWYWTLFGAVPNLEINQMLSVKDRERNIKIIEFWILVMFRTEIDLHQVRNWLESGLKSTWIRSEIDLNQVRNRLESGPK